MPTHPLSTVTSDPDPSAQPHSSLGYWPISWEDHVPQTGSEFILLVVLSSRVLAPIGVRLEMPSFFLRWPPPEFHDDISAA